MDAEVLLELLSERLLADFPAGLWREVFVGPGYDTIRFECGVVTFLSVEGLDSDWTKPALTALARKHMGHVECFGPPSTFAFPEARHALQLAVLLQAECGHSLRMALLTAPCTMASFQVDGSGSRLSLGAEASVAANKARTVSRGSIYVWGETYPLLARSLERHAHPAVIAKEVQDGVVTSAVITFPPAPSTGSSTFAGLGLTAGAP